MSLKNNNMDLQKKQKSVSPTSSTVLKKPFNKKEWREKRYNIKLKVQRWKLKRQEAMKQNYLKQLKAEGITTSLPEKNQEQMKRHKTTVNDVLKEQRLIKAKGKEEKERRRAEIKKALNEYKEKKARKHRILSQTNKKGQPSMKGRIELLLEKIEKTYGT